MDAGRDFDEMSPRRRPPVGHGTHSIARVQPLVPELSMFLPNAIDRQHLFTLPKSNSLRENNYVCKPASTTPVELLPLSKQEVLFKDSKSCLEKQKVYIQSFNEQCESRNISLDGHHEKENQFRNAPSSPALSEEVVTLFKQQNEVINDLIAQVRELQQMRYSEKQRPASELRDVSTQTSVIRDCKLFLVDESVQASPSIRGSEQFENNAFTLSEVDGGEEHLDLGASASNLGNISADPDIKECDEIMRQLERVSSSPDVKSPPPKNVISATYDRLQNIGITFLDKDDFHKKQLEDGNYFNSLYPPHLRLDKLRNTESISTASSLERNSSALKQLDDSTLGQLARKMCLQHGLESTNVTKFGLSDHHLSKSTRDFLLGNGLASCEPNDHRSKKQSNCDEPLNGLTGLLRQPKFKN